MTEYEKILNDARENPDILGLILVGSRGKGFENEYSDYDLVMIAKPEAVETLEQAYDGAKDIDITIYSLSSFKEHASWDSPDAWDRYNYAHVQVLVQKTDELTALIEEKGHIPEDKQKQVVEWWIDAYLNGLYRSVKCIRNNNEFGAHLAASTSMVDLLNLVFALNGRHRPFLDYVEKELEKYPLEKLPWTPTVFIDKVQNVLTNADLSTQQELAHGIEALVRDMGYGHMLDAWEGKDIWAITFQKTNT